MSSLRVKGPLMGGLMAVVPLDGKPLLQLFGSAMSPPAELFQVVSAHATPATKDAENAKRRPMSLNVPICCFVMCPSFEIFLKSGHGTISKRSVPPDMTSDWRMNGSFSSRPFNRTRATRMPSARPGVSTVNVLPLPRRNAMRFTPGA